MAAAMAPAADPIFAPERSATMARAAWGRRTASPLSDPFQPRETTAGALAAAVFLRPPGNTKGCFRRETLRAGCNSQIPCQCPPALRLGEPFFWRENHGVT